MKNNLVVATVALLYAISMLILYAGLLLGIIYASAWLVMTVMNYLIIYFGWNIRLLNIWSTLAIVFLLSFLKTYLIKTK